MRYLAWRRRTEESGWDLVWVRCDPDTDQFIDGRYVGFSPLKQMQLNECPLPSDYLEWLPEQ